MLDRTHPCGSADDDTVHDAPFVARDMFEDHRLDDGSVVKFPGMVSKLSKTRGKTEWLGLELGQHIDGILAAPGYGAYERAMLRSDGVI